MLRGEAEQSVLNVVFYPGTFSRGNTMPSTQRQNQVFHDLQQRHKGDPLLGHVERILQALGVNQLQVISFDDTVGIHVTFYKDNKRLTVSISED